MVYSVNLRRVAGYIIPWFCFWGLFAWGWRVRNIFIALPNYGDVLEVTWGIRWYHDAILLEHSSPLFASFVFHPTGWHTPTLAYTPVLFLVSLPLYELGGVAFAYNTLAILALVVAFAGSFRLARLFTSQSIAIMAALAFTFWRMCWDWVGGHLNMTWVSGLLPWLVWGIARGRRSRLLKWAIFSGIVWGVMINFALYGIFIGALAFTLLGVQALRVHRLRQIMVAGLIAFVIGLPTILLYMWGSQQDQTHFYGIEHNMWWGASLNSLFVPSVFHPLPPVRQLSRWLYTGPRNESGVMNFGPVTSILALISAITIAKSKPCNRGLVWLTLTGIVLSLGLLLRWNGEVVQHPVFRPLESAIWNIGHVLKPGVFPLPRSGPFESGVPLPGLVLTAVIPFWESARTVSRYAVVGLLGAVVLAGLALERLPRSVRYPLLVLWLIEVWPLPVNNVPVPLQPHAAYAWLAEQNLSGEGIVELSYPTLRISGEVLWATLLHQKPTASGSGSSWPTHTAFLWHYFLSDPEALSRPQTGIILQQYRVRYIFLYMLGEEEEEMWAMAQENPAFEPLRCFDPPPGPSPWYWPICVIRVLPLRAPFNVLFSQGWSSPEDWGIWADGTDSEILWVAPDSRDYILLWEAFPHCVPGQPQSLSVEMSGVQLAAYQWQNCEPHGGEVTVPASLIRIGWNGLRFHYTYAARPVDVTAGANPDPRMLSVGFTKLEIQESP